MVKKLLLLSAIVGVIALAVAWASPRASEATTWNPAFGSTDFYRLVPSTPGANGDTEAQYNVNAPSANFSALFGRAITFGDSDVVTASAAGIPNTGAYIGELASVAILGLANEGCNQSVPVTFNFVDANVLVDDLAMTPNVTLTGALTAGATSFTYTSTGDPIGPSDNNPQRIRAEIEIDTERMLVTAINEGTNTYTTVQRGWLGTTPAAHSAGAQIRKVTTIFPAGPADNLLANMAEDDGDLDNNGTAEFPAFAGNQVSDGADTTPGFIRDSFDPDGDPATGVNGGYVTPHARYYGVAFVASSLIVTLQFVISAPGDLAANNFQNLGWAPSEWGYANTTFLQDPLAPPSNSAISDFCNFQSNTRLFGITHDNLCTGASPPVACTGTGAGFTLRLAVDGGCPGSTTPNECGSVRSTNPPTDQTVRYYQYGVSQRDTDNDGHENALDVCHSTANAGWNPRAFNGSSGADSDADGLPTACDPNDLAFANDQDGDLWQNRIDNCSVTANTDPGPPAGGGGIVPNTFQFDQDVDPGVAGVANHVSDGGPSSDSIGVACDANDTTADGHYHASYASRSICIGAATASCSAADADGDGIDNAADTCFGGANPIPALNFSQHMRDLNNTGFVDTADIVLLTGVFGAGGGSGVAVNSYGAVGYQARFDINTGVPSNFIDTGDISQLTGVFGATCGPPP